MTLKIVEMRRSTSRAGGWLVQAKPKRDFDKLIKQFDGHWWKYYPRGGSYWLTEFAMNKIAPEVVNFEEMCKLAGRTLPPPQPPPPAQEKMTPYRAMYLRDNAPIEVVDAVYRALAKLVHPDLAKDESDRQHRHERMKRLNLAYETIKGERK